MGVDEIMLDRNREPHRIRPYHRSVELQRLREEVDEAITFNHRLHGVQDRELLYCPCCDDYKLMQYVGDYTIQDKVYAKGYSCECGDSLSKRVE